jgi:hypothetical protein
MFSQQHAEYIYIYILDKPGSGERRWDDPFGTFPIFNLIEANPYKQRRRRVAVTKSIKVKKIITLYT